MYIYNATWHIFNIRLALLLSGGGEFAFVVSREAKGIYSYIE